MRRNTEIAADVRIGEEVATILRQGTSTASEARVLGRETSGDVERVYLDRLVHAPWEQKLGEWGCTGAVTTILHRASG